MAPLWHPYGTLMVTLTQRLELQVINTIYDGKDFTTYCLTD
jgi:hypothetical protein